MQVSPAGLNAATARLFIAGAGCFVLGSVPGYADLVGRFPDDLTFFVGSLLFTVASLGQLLQAQTPAMQQPDPDTEHRPAPVRWLAWQPHDRNWCAAAAQFPGTLLFNVSTGAALVHNLTVKQQDRHVWRPDIFGSTLFLVASIFGILAVGSLWHSIPGAIAWLNFLGSMLFMAAALASYVLPSGDLVDEVVAVAGTLLGALCFLVGAVLMFPAWHTQRTPQKETP